MQCINPIFDPKMVILTLFFSSSIPMTHKCTQCNFSTGTVAHEISQQNTHWRESKQMQLFCNHIIRHMLTLSGEKPHKCTECKKSFSQARNQSTHMVIHSHWRESPHLCTVQKVIHTNWKIEGAHINQQWIKATQLNYRAEAPPDSEFC